MDAGPSRLSRRSPYWSALRGDGGSRCGSRRFPHFGKTLSGITMNLGFFCCEIQHSHLTAPSDKLCIVGLHID